MRDETHGSASGSELSSHSGGEKSCGVKRDVMARHGREGTASPADAVYAAIDLGTNNCRLLVARPTPRGFRVVDAFSRIVRLGEGLTASGRLGEPAMERAAAALEVCAAKMEARGVTRARVIATEACRAAANGSDFCADVRARTGLDLEVVDRRTEAGLAAAGCAPLVDPNCDGAILFDIGGGSTEVVWLGRRSAGDDGPPRARIRSWISLPVGVVSLSERHGGVRVSPDVFRDMVSEVRAMLEGVRESWGLRAPVRLHLLGTSGTVTTVAGIHLGLKRYDRTRVDGTWLSAQSICGVVDRLTTMSFEERVANPCIGAQRADLVLAGCAIMEAVREVFPADRLRVADRGLREGMLVQLMRADGVWRRARPGEAEPHDGGRPLSGQPAAPGRLDGTREERPPPAGAGAHVASGSAAVQGAGQGAGNGAGNGSGQSTGFGTKAGMGGGVKSGKMKSFKSGGRHKSRKASRSGSHPGSHS